MRAEQGHLFPPAQTPILRPALRPPLPPRPTHAAHSHAPKRSPRLSSSQVFNVAGYYGADQAVLSLYALGRLSGTVVDIGYGKLGARARAQAAQWVGPCWGVSS